ncbi:2'-5' RNA ligase family protein [Pedobacter cryophilus]|nr:2'-5' RNA ligase family protein [Pedobacter cryophilus]
MKSLYFIAILPPKATDERIDLIRKEFSNQYKSYEALKPPVHLTLKEPFTLDKKDEALLLRKLEGLSFIHQPFHQELKDFNRFQKHSIYIKANKCEEIINLKKNIKKLFRAYFFNVQQDQMPFNPHYTIAYRDIPEKEFDLAWEEYQHKTFEAHFTCTHFTLLKHTGIKWITVQDYKLRGCPIQTLFDHLTSFQLEKALQQLIVK